MKNYKLYFDYKIANRVGYGLFVLPTIILQYDNAFNEKLISINIVWLWFDLGFIYRIR